METKTIDVQGTYILQERKETLKELKLIVRTSKKPIKHMWSLFLHKGRAKKVHVFSQEEIKSIYPNRMYA